MIIYCANCKGPRGSEGSGKVMFFGEMTLVCLGCKWQILKNAKKPKKKRLVSSNGKARPVQTGNAATFSAGAPIFPSVLAGYTGRDVRFQVDEKTFKGGDFMAEWKRLRS